MISLPPGLPDHPDRTRLEQALADLHRDLSRLDAGSLGLSAYGERYLRDHQGILAYSLQTAATLLLWTLGARPGSWSTATLVDYGAGLGLQGLLARAAGVGRVVLCDLFAESCDNASRLGRGLGLEADAIIPGDLPDLVRACRARQLDPDAIISYDVLEHIYDLPGHIALLPSLGRAPLHLAYASSANAANPRLRSRLMAGHRRIELQGVPPRPGSRPDDSPSAFLALRRDLLARHAPGLAAEDLDRLAEMTRGLAGEDLATAARMRAAGHDLPYRPDHPTNTCDPATGNWHECLVSHPDLLRWFEQAGFQASIRGGYYGAIGGWGPRTVKRILNTAIRLAPRRSVALAPCFVVQASLPAADHRRPSALPVHARATRLPPS